jgi:hypothetical protein
MKILRSVGIVALLLGYLFKVMHWPGANLLALTGACLFVAMLIVQFVTGRDRTIGERLRPGVGVLLVVAGLMHMLNWPGGTLLFYAAALAASFLLLSDRTRVDLPRLGMIRGWALLLSGTLALLCGIVFKALHWPGAGILMVIGIAGCVVWALLSGLRRQPAA